VANRLKMATIEAIRGLLKQGWSQRRVARELGVDRETVARYARAGEPQAPKPAISTAGRPSQCDPYRLVVEGKLEAGLSAQRIWQDPVSEHGFGGAYESVKRFVRQLRGGRQLPFRRIESSPGAEAQVDFGRGGWIVDGSGKRRRPHVLRVVLSYSRRGYSEGVWRQDTESFLRCLENAFQHFGGVPRTLVIDYVPRNIVDLMCPSRICAAAPAKAVLLWRIACSRAHNHSRRLKPFEERPVIAPNEALREFRRRTRRWRRFEASAPSYTGSRV
jgi:transposase